MENVILCKTKNKIDFIRSIGMSRVGIKGGLKAFINQGGMYDVLFCKRVVLFIS